MRANYVMSGWKLEVDFGGTRNLHHGRARVGEDQFEPIDLSWRLLFARHNTTGSTLTRHAPTSAWHAHGSTRRL